MQVADSGWSIQFKTAEEDEGGDGKYFYFWIGEKGWNKDQTFEQKILEKLAKAKFKAIAEQIRYHDGEEANRKELQSKKDGNRQRIKYKMKTGYIYVRFNITIL